MVLSRNHNINFPLRKTGKHGDTTLALQGKIFVQDLTIFMDVKANPGPEQLNETSSRNASTRGILKLSATNNGTITYSSRELIALRTKSSNTIPSSLFQTLKHLGILKTRRVRGGKRVKAKEYKIRVVYNHRNLCGSVSPAPINYLSSSERSNLTHIQITTIESSMPRRPLDFCLLNVRSIRNKALLIKDYVVEHNLEILAITETWLKSGDQDTYYAKEICPTGYDFHHIPRADANGGGVGLLVKKTLQIRKQNLEKFKSFEYMDVLVKYANTCTRLVILYRPPPSKENGLKEIDFFGDFNSLLERLAITTSKLLIAGDFNFHVNKPSETYAKKVSWYAKDFQSGTTCQRLHTQERKHLRSNYYSF